MRWRGHYKYYSLPVGVGRPNKNNRPKESAMTPNEKEEQISMLIRFFNVEAGTNFKVDEVYNRNLAASAIEKITDKRGKVGDHIKKMVARGEKRISNVFKSYGEDETQEEEVAAVDEKKAKAKERRQTNNYMGLLEKAVVELVAKTSAEEIERKTFDAVEEKVRNFIKSEYGTIERKIVTYVDTKKVEMEGVQHDKFEQVLKFVSNNEPVFLTGQAGTGKNVLCQQVATALGLEFYFSNAVTQEYKITGFTDAMGVFQETQFYKAFKNGGLFMLDEMDASIPEVLIILNAAIANRYFDFPAPIGKIEAHENFRIIAAGNTFGMGADYEYVGRNQLDMASLDRFAMVKIDYSEAIEICVSNGNRELVDFVREMRESCSKNGIRLVISYRAIGRINKMENLLGIIDTLKTCLIKGSEIEDIRLAVNNCNNKENKYHKALLKIIKEA